MLMGFIYFYFIFSQTANECIIFYHVMKCNDSLWTFPTKTTEKTNLLDVHLGNLIFALFFFIVKNFVILLLTGVI